MKKARRLSQVVLGLLGMGVVSLVVLGFILPHVGSGRVRSYFGWSTSRIVDSAHRVEVLRIAQAPRLKDLNAMGAPVAPEQDWVRRLRDVLWDPSSYAWGVAKACVPSPGVAVRFHHGEEHVDLLLCFECNMLSLGGPKWGDFDPARPVLVRLAKEALPLDPKIQGLDKGR